MELKITRTSAFERDLKSLKKNKIIRDLVISKIEEICANPYCGKLYSENMKGYRKVKFHSNPSMRLIYQFDEEQNLLVFNWVKTKQQCDNLYNLGKLFFDQYRL